MDVLAIQFAFAVLFFCKEKEKSERFGDFVVRKGIIKETLGVTCNVFKSPWFSSVMSP